MSTPTDPAVITALSAILDIDGRALFDKAGVSIPAEESHPTVEQAFASLAPLPLEEPIEEDVVPDPLVVDEPEAEVEVEPAEVELDADSELEAEVHEHIEKAAEPDVYPIREPEPVLDTFSLPPEETPIGELVAAETGSNDEPAAFVSPPEPYVISAPTPQVVEPSYIEDTNQRQLYRVRNLATVALVVILVIVFLWSIGNTLDAIGTWWDEFTGNLRL